MMAYRCSSYQKPTVDAMAKLTDINTAADLVRLGAFGDIDRHGGLKLLVSQMVEFLLQDYGGNPDLTRAAALIVAREYQAARSSGATLNRRRSDRPLTDAELTRVVGCSGTIFFGYEYTVVVKMRNATTGIVKSYPIVIRDTDNLGKNTLVAMASSQMQSMIRNDTVLSGLGADPSRVEVVDARITSAARCV
jgi:hypothetical protein